MIFVNCVVVIGLIGLCVLLLFFINECDEMQRKYNIASSNYRTYKSKYEDMLAELKVRQDMLDCTPASATYCPPSDVYFGGVKCTDASHRCSFTYTPYNRAFTIQHGECQVMYGVQELLDILEQLHVIQIKVQ